MKVIGFGAALVDKQFLIKDDALNALGIEKGLMTLNSEEEQNELLTFLQNQNYDQISSCGGSATNSIYAAAALGTSSGFIGKVAEDESHHPDISFGWGYCKVKIFTHAIKGLAESDFI